MAIQDLGVKTKVTFKKQAFTKDTPCICFVDDVIVSLIWNHCLELIAWVFKCSGVRVGKGNLVPKLFPGERVVLKDAVSHGVRKFFHHAEFCLVMKWNYQLTLAQCETLPLPFCLSWLNQHFINCWLTDTLM